MLPLCGTVNAIDCRFVLIAYLIQFRVYQSITVTFVAPIVLTDSTLQFTAWFESKTAKKFILSAIQAQAMIILCLLRYRSPGTVCHCP